MSDKRKAPPGADSHRKVQPDDRGRSVWVDPVTTAEFELVSTQTLQAMIDAGDAGHIDEFERIASDDHDGYLAQEAATGRFRIIDDDSLQAILDEQREHPSTTDNIGDTVKLERPDLDGPTSEDDQELSLVSTQALRKILGEADLDKPAAKKKSKKDEGGGFDPYDTG